MTEVLPPLRVLLVEDSATDAKLVLQALRGLGRPIEHERVDDAGSMRALLEERPWDVVLSDWSMPKFSGLEALALVKVLKVDLPFILVSGTVGEDTAVLAMRSGAHDYVLKDRLERLPAAVARELASHEERVATRLRDAEHRRLERRYRRILETTHEGVFVTDTERRIVFANARLEEMLGYAAGELNGRSQAVLILDVDRAVASESFGHRSRGIAENGEFRLRRKDGTELWVQRSSSPLLDDDGRFAGMFAMVTDLTERKRAEESLRRTEEQLRQSQKMDAVGRLAGGIAHDFNNVLSVILGFGEMMLSELKPGEPMCDDLHEINRAAMRAADLTRQLLMFSRQQVLEPKVLDLNEVLAGMDRMLQRILGADVDLVSLPTQPLGRVRADLSNIEQVIMNLVVNARDAMPRGGKLTIETANVKLDAAYAETHAGVAPGGYVMLAVTDSGAGMDAATRKRIFEPFFTTKGKGTGTGLGLSTVFGIVRQSGGNIWVYSEPGHGTTMKVYLPQARGSNTAMDTVPTESRTRRGSETVLLVEDDEQVRVLTRTILERYGYHVLEASSGGDALLICEQHKAAIHILLTDVIMSRMSGRELAERLAPLRPEMKVLYMSGYTDDSVVRHGILQSDVAFLQKPIIPETLTRKVRHVLDAAPAA